MATFRKSIDTDLFLVGYYQGKNATELAILFAVSSSTIAREFARFGLNPRKCGNGGLVAARNPNWKGGRLVSSQGYVFRRTAIGKYVQEHRKVMEETIGRALLPSEIVHHRDGNKQNNSPENLELIASQPEHMKEHMPESEARRRGFRSTQKILCKCGREISTANIGKHQRSKFCKFLAFAKLEVA